MSSIANESIADGRYGPATPEVQALIALERLTIPPERAVFRPISNPDQGLCFTLLADRASAALTARTPTTATPGEIETLIQSHLDRLTAVGAGVGPGMVGITFVMADALLSTRFGQGVDPETAWESDWTPYREAVRSLRRRLNDVASTDSVCRGRIIPPLWPFAGKPSVFSEPRIARYSKAPPPIPWLLLCELEEALTDGLLWAVTRSDPEGNPFRPLLEIGALGLAPMGLQGERFLIYVPVAASCLNNA